MLDIGYIIPPAQSKMLCEQGLSHKNPKSKRAHSITYIANILILIVQYVSLLSPWAMYQIRDTNMQN